MNRSLFRWELLLTLCGCLLLAATWLVPALHKNGVLLLGWGMVVAGVLAYIRHLKKQNRY